MSVEQNKGYLFVQLFHQAKLMFFRQNFKLQRGNSSLQEPSI